jgi:molecular chaperone DnaK
LLTTEQAIESYADLLDAARMEQVKQDLETLRGLLDTGDLEALRNAYTKLESATFEIAEAMYGGT